MRVLDASAIVYAWENYPIGQFSRVWTWLGTEIQGMQLQIPFVALEEVDHVEPECGKWLNQAKIGVMPMSPQVVAEASRIKALLGIVGDKYGSGVDENDLLIVASARINGFDLITNEAIQPSLPKSQANYKIPAVCNLPPVKVPSYPFLGYLTRSGKPF